MTIYNFPRTATLGQRGSHPSSKNFGVINFSVWYVV